MACILTSAYERRFPSKKNSSPNSHGNIPLITLYSRCKLMSWKSFNLSYGNKRFKKGGSISTQVEKILFIRKLYSSRFRNSSKYWSKCHWKFKKSSSNPGQNLKATIGLDQKTLMSNFLRNFWPLLPIVHFRNSFSDH